MDYVRSKSLIKKSIAKLVPHKTIQYRSMSLQGAFEDYGILKAIAKGTHEPFFEQLFEQSIQPGMTIIDIGAHLGKYVLLAGQKLGSSGRVFAFEPHPRTFRYLERNVISNLPNGGVRIFNFAISKENSRAYLNADMLQSDYTSLSFVRDDREVQKFEIETRRLESVSPDLQSIDCMKIDVEGAELLALEGCEKIIAASKTEGRPLKLFIESNPEALRAFGASPQALLEKIAEMGFEKVRIIDEASRKLESLQPGWERHCHNLFCEF
ncbi:MAG: FkbM family methyltransferase [Oligoflexus sp.]